MKTPSLMIATGMVTLILIGACNSSPTESKEQPPGEATTTPVGGQAMIEDNESAKNIIQVAAGSADHTTLVAAIKAADLVNVLANNGPFTVFAPTNAAFEALPAGTVASLLEPENKSKLINIIHYHAAPGSYKGALLKNGMNMFMANGLNSKIEVNETGDVSVNGAKILATVQATNGVIHIVDKVLLPPEK